MQINTRLQRHQSSFHDLQTLLLCSLGLLSSPSAATSLPTLRLPWGVYQAQIAPYNPAPEEVRNLFKLSIESS